jgi:hypothetical protein
MSRKQLDFAVLGDTTLPELARRPPEGQLGEGCVIGGRSSAAQLRPPARRPRRPYGGQPHRPISHKPRHLHEVILVQARRSSIVGLCRKY